MIIKRHEKEQELHIKFSQDLIKSNMLAPGITKNKNSLLDNMDYDFMCSVDVKKDIEKTFGCSSLFIQGKSRKATFFAFSFKEQTIACTCESAGVGTSWHLLSPDVPGSRYGNYMLLSCDKEIKDFWPDFCINFKELTNNPGRVKKNKF